MEPLYCLISKQDSIREPVLETLIESTVRSLDGRDAALYPFLPYLLQDLWEIGASPEIIVGQIRKHRLSREIRTALDLGCGKGAVSIHLARSFGWQIHGIDGLPAFIDDAEKKADEYGVSGLCHFEIGDIREKIPHLPEYDLVLLGSIGPVLGSLSETLQSVRPCIRAEGYGLLDDGYAPDRRKSHHFAYPTRDQAHHAIRQSGFAIVDEYIHPKEDLVVSDQTIYRQIEKRARELTKKHPDQQSLFEGYLQAQREENAVLENDIVCATWLLNKTG